ncbi:MAG TPA: branched chain amino acid aminotransferase, partial [Burkholderiales bacterium]|nr:branched chain amino acid aminotransferase [Burkholderiales bacterium]
RKIGNGGRGHITARLQKMFFDCVTGRSEAHSDWLTLV